MIKNTLRRFGVSLVSTFKRGTFKTPISANFVPSFSFTTANNPDGQKSGKPQTHSRLNPLDTHQHSKDCSHDNLEQHKQPPPQQNHQHQHHHHHDGQPCNHDHSQDNNQVHIPPQNLELVMKDHNVDDQSFTTFTTKNSISILDKIGGTKEAANHQLLVLMFTCKKCEERSIRSFTKNSYQNGVVLIRCGGCQNIHLIADNLGWFQDQKTNVQTMSGVKRVSNSVDVMKILNTVFKQSENPQASPPGPLGESDGKQQKSPDHPKNNSSP